MTLYYFDQLGDLFYLIIERDACSDYQSLPKELDVCSDSSSPK